MAREDEFERPTSGLQKARERLENTAMVLVRPEVGRVDKVIAVGESGGFCIGEFGRVGTLRLRQSGRHQENIRGLRPWVREEGLPGVFGQRRDSAGVCQGLGEPSTPTLQDLWAEELGVIVVLEVRNDDHLARHGEGKAAVEGVAAEQDVEAEV